MNDGLPLVSVIMPVRNGADFLAPAVQSILDQTFSDFEFIIIDDGSTDGTPVLLSALAKSDTRIRLMQSSGDGIVIALNEGLRSARGDLIARMDADDISLPDRFALQVEALQAMPGLVALGSQAITIDSHGCETGSMGMPTDEASASDELMHRNIFIHPSMMFRRIAAIEAGLYRAACIYAEDYDLWLRLAERGGMANMPQPLLRFRRHSHQTSKTRRRTQRAASAFARQMAMRRRNGKPEGIDMSQPLQPALGIFLHQRAERSDAMGRSECKDIEIILREAHAGIDASVIQKLMRLLNSGLTGWERLRLRFRLAFASRRPAIASQNSTLIH